MFPVYHSYPYRKPGLPNVMKMKSLFSDNSMVYYKRGSLASGGVGTVVNSTIKARKT